MSKEVKLEPDVIRGVEIWAGADVHLATCHGTREQAQSRAKDICHRCNTQPELLAACKTHKKSVIAAYGNTHWDANYFLLYKDMEAAIAAAEKK